MKRRCSAFTLAEILVTTSVASVLGGIIYIVASEGLSSFANNASINRTYSDAHRVVFQVDNAIKVAGNNPQVLDNTGATPVPTPTPSGSNPTPVPFPGVRFYCAGTAPASNSSASYLIPSGKSTDSFLTLKFTAGQATNGTPPILVGDLVTIPLIGFQDTVISSSGYTHNTDGSGGITLNFAKPIYQNCTPALPVDANKNTVPVAFTPTTTTPVVYYTCLSFRQVAFIAVPNSSNGADLRYYPQAMSTGNGSACGNLAAFNNATAFNNAQNFQVIATVPGTVTDPALTPLKPFTVNQALSPTVLSISMCTISPDYSNRNLRPSNSFSLEYSAMAPRSPALLHVTSIPF